MKKIAFVFILLLSFMVGAATVSADPIDFTTFLTDVGVTVLSDGYTVTFVEQQDGAPVGCYDEYFIVNPNVTAFSFYYSFQEGLHNDDYLAVVINGDQFLYVSDDTGSGLYQFDVLDYIKPDSTISLEVRLASNANETLWDSTAIISNHPVPEPGTCLLLGMGLVGLFGLRRKKVANNI